jgi:hypothetical protein
MPAPSLGRRINSDIKKNLSAREYLMAESAGWFIQEWRAVSSSRSPGGGSYIEASTATSESYLKKSGVKTIDL